MSGNGVHQTLRFISRDVCVAYKQSLEQAKDWTSSFPGHRSQIENCKQGKLFHLRILAAKPALVLPAHDSEKQVPENFSQFFSDKVKKVKDELNSLPTTKYVYKLVCTSTVDVTPFNEFRKLTLEEVKKNIMESISKACALDPAPTWLLKECIDVLFFWILSQ